jgi:hypothetical protein
VQIDDEFQGFITCLPDQLSWFGLHERILVANMVIWVEVMAAWLLRLSLRVQ